MAERPLALHESATFRHCAAMGPHAAVVDGVIGLGLRRCPRLPSSPASDRLPSGRRFLIGTEPADQLVCRDANLLSEAAVLMGLLLVGLQAVAGSLDLTRKQGTGVLSIFPIVR
jgi:hypothetical protein